MSTPRVLVTGSSGFIGGYVVEELLRRGYRVVGVDNHSKYGKVTKSYDDDPGYELVEADAQDTALLTSSPTTCSPRTSGSSRRRVTRRSPRSATGPSRR